MDDEIELISDGDGLAIIGEESAVERFLIAEGLTTTRELNLPRLSTSLQTGSAVVQAGSEAAANSGRWMKLTEESATVAKKYPLVKNKKTGNLHATARAKNGRFAGGLQFEPGLGKLATNPALLAGAAGLMAQLAMQQTMDEITDYLAVIDQKVDDVLRAQKDAVLADMIGVELVIDEAMTIRKEVGRVSEVTWSKIQSTSATVASTQAYALRRLDALAEKLEGQSDFGDLAKAAKAAEDSAQEWLAVLARCFQLQEATAILELDRVFDAAPDELERHRIGLRTARTNRIELIARSTERLLTRIQQAAGTANMKVLVHPAKAPAIVRSSNYVSSSVIDFRQSLGIESAAHASEARRWRDAAAATRDKALVASATGVDAAKRFGGESVGRVKAVKGRLSDARSVRAQRREQQASDELEG